MSTSTLASWPGLVQVLAGGQGEHKMMTNVNILGIEQILVKCLAYDEDDVRHVPSDMISRIRRYGWLRKPWPYLTHVQRLGLCFGISESKRFPCLRGLLLTKHIHFNFFMHGELHVL
jgi:hypothetical protein